MKKNIWDFYAPIYNLFISPNAKAYNKICDNIKKVIKDKKVLEIATGTGIIAKKVADFSNEMIATDFSTGMINQAKKKNTHKNLSFEVADATSLPYNAETFDIVIISNALHIIPDVKKAMSEIKRVLKTDGILIAPNFIHKDSDENRKLWSKLLSLAKIDFQRHWKESDYQTFLENHGFTVTKTEIHQGFIPIMYSECKKN
ncbi:class I SAM-dependent methyltransferase [Treponema pectinovorum]|uniref:class I SAM-dependent methyltransferase n=1 Tax=Treponema pectinovorum TaxID=164 RepID=UPI0011CA3D8B|nr:class I SAM-dependent methyltransferase [Treponema pectinovorum]